MVQDGGLGEIPGAQTYQSSYCILIVSLHYQYSALRLNTSLRWIYTTQTRNISKFLNVRNTLLFVLAITTLVFGIIEEGVENGWHEGVILVIATATIVLFTYFCKCQQIVETQIDKLEKDIQIRGLVIGIICLIVSFLWYKFGKRDDVKESKHEARYLLQLLFMLLVGVTQKVPFVSLPIRYFNARKSIYANIQQFLQHFLIMSSSSSLIILLGTVAFGDAPLTAWDLLWVNLVEAVLGGYVSLTKPSIDIPMKSISGKRLITPSMTKNISLQVLYQTVWCMGLQKATGVGAMVSNSFILCQFFNIVNARELEIKNIFGGISRHAVGVWIAGIIFMALQVGFVMIDEWFGYGAKLDWKLWVVCLVIGLGSWLVDYVYRRASGQKSEPK